MATPKVPAEGYRYLREGKRELLIKEGEEARLRRLGLMSPSGLWDLYPPSSLSGRGEVLIFEDTKGGVAIRRYRHGGLLRRLTGDRFLFGNRPFHELYITDLARRLGIPTLDPLAAIKEKRLFCYRGYLITVFLPHATDMIAYLKRTSDIRRRWSAIAGAAAAVNMMHHGGIYHADLHLKNFLVEDGGKKVYIIDFDRSKIDPRLSHRRRIRNLLRLERSAEKLKRLGLPLTESEKRRFCLAYAATDEGILPRIMRLRKSFGWRTFVYRAGWWIAVLFYPQGRLRRNSTT